MKNLSPRSRPQLLFSFLLALFILIGLLRIVATYHVFWQTWDEPAHIGPGMEWLDKGRFTYEHFHPPLARVMSALGPYLAGLRSVGKATMYEEGNLILFENNAYEYNLTLARLGILPFFILATVVVAAWAKVYGGMVPALLAVVFVTTSPSILGHSGVAASRRITRYAACYCCLRHRYRYRYRYRHRHHHWHVCGGSRRDK